MDQETIHKLIQKFWDGTATREEMTLLQAYLENNELDKTELSLPTEQKADHLLDAGHKEILLSKMTTIIQNNQKDYGQSKRRSIYKWSAVAAAILILLFISSVVLKTMHNEQPSMKPPGTLIAAIVMDTLHNKTQKIKSYTLPDQTEVKLYPNSQISFSKDFMERNIQLTGKALFMVMHDSAHIFTVTTADIQTTDIGTTFEIDARNTNKISIHLIEGEVKVGKTTASKTEFKDQYLTQNEVLKITRQADKVVLERYPFQPKATRQSKALAFSKTPLPEVMKAISHKYHCKIQFHQNEIEQLTFTGNIEPEDALENILNIICTINNLSYSKNDSGYTIDKPQ